MPPSNPAALKQEETKQGQKIYDIYLDISYEKTQITIESFVLFLVNISCSENVIEVPAKFHEVVSCSDITCHRVGVAISATE